MTVMALVIFSAVVVVLFGYRQFNQWTESETAGENSDSELLAYAPPKSFTSGGRFLAVASFYCLTLLAFYAVLYTIFAEPSLGEGVLEFAGITPENAWLAALFVVTGLSPVLPGFAHVERSVRVVMHSWAVVPEKANQLAGDIASPCTSYKLDPQHIDQILPRVDSVLSADDFLTGDAATPAAKWARLNYLFYKFAPPVEKGLRFKSPYTARFQSEFVALGREVRELAQHNASALRARPSSQALVALSDRMDQLLHRLYVLIGCRAFGETRSWEGAREYLENVYGVVVKDVRGASFPIGPVVGPLLVMAGSVALVSLVYGHVFQELTAQVSPLIWGLTALATHAAGTLAAWIVFQHSRKRQAAFHNGFGAPLSVERIVVVTVLAFSLALIPVELGTVHHLVKAGAGANQSLLQTAAAAFDIAWPWAFIGVVTGLAAYFHLERTSNAPSRLSVRVLSGVVQAGLNVALALVIALAYSPLPLKGAMLALVLLLSGLIGLQLGFFMPSALYRHGRDRRGGAIRQAIQGEVVITFGGPQVQGRLVQMSFSGCTATVSQRAAQYLSGRNGTVTLNGKIGVPAFFARIVDTDEKGVQMALAFSSERKFYYLSKEVRQGISNLLSQAGAATPAAVAAM